MRHTELMCPLAFWNGPPQHRITALYVQRSRRWGDFILTGTNRGEVCLWRSALTSEHKPVFLAVALMFNTNNTSIRTIHGNFIYKEQPAFVCIHANGNPVIWSITGGGALKENTADRSILPWPCQDIWGYDLDEDENFYQYAICSSDGAVSTEGPEICVLDFSKCRVMKRFKLDPFIGACQYRTPHGEKFTTVAMDGILRLYDLFAAEVNPVSEQQTILNGVPQDITASDDGSFLVIVAYTELVIYSVDPLALLCKVEVPGKRWNGIRFAASGGKGGSNFKNSESASVNLVVWEIGNSVSSYAVTFEKSRESEAKISLISNWETPSPRTWRVLRKDTSNHFFIGTTGGEVWFYRGDKEERFRADFKPYRIAKVSEGFFSSNRNASSSAVMDLDSQAGCTATCMAVTRLGTLLAKGYRAGNIVVYNVIKGEVHLKLKEHSAMVTCMMIISPDIKGKELQSDGALFAGYHDGTVQVFDTKNGVLLKTHKSHLGSVMHFRRFPDDYFVFSIGADQALCSYLLFQQLGSNLVDSRDDDPELVRVHWYRGHSDKITQLHRTPWCIHSDLVLAQCANDEMFVWCVSTSQLERRMHPIDAAMFIKSRELEEFTLRPELPHHSKDCFQAFDLQGTDRDLNLNLLIMDIFSLGELSTSGIPKLENPSQQKLASEADDAKDYNETKRLGGLLGLLLDWRLKSDLDKRFATSLGVQPSGLRPCFGFCGEYESVVLLFPKASNKGGRWRFHQKFTAIYMLTLNSVCRWLMKVCSPRQQTACSRLVTYYLIQIPETMDGFLEPSRNIMAHYCLNGVFEIRNSARVLLSGIVTRMSEENRKALIIKWDRKFCKGNELGPGLVDSPERFQAVSQHQRESQGSMAHRVKGSVSVLLGAIVICMIEDANKNHASHISVQVPPPVIQTVVETIAAVFEHKPCNMTDVIKTTFACDYLGKVLHAWMSHIDNFDHILWMLLDMSTSQWEMLKESAIRTLLQAGKANCLKFVKLLGNIALNDASIQRRNTALFTLIHMAKKSPQTLLKHLPLTVETVIKCLDPANPKRRQSLIKASTATLHCLVQKYPSVAFHQVSQHFATGTGRKRDCAIVIYDLRTATKWRVLKGHKGRITALEFNAEGDSLVSYAGYENPSTLRVWALGSDGFISTILGNKHRCVKVVELTPIKQEFSPLEHLQTSELSWVANYGGRNIDGGDRRTGGSKRIRLIREDGSRFFFKP